MKKTQAWVRRLFERTFTYISGLTLIEWMTVASTIAIAAAIAYRFFSADGGE